MMLSLIQYQYKNKYEAKSIWNFKWMLFILILLAYILIFANLFIIYWKPCFLNDLNISKSLYFGFYYFKVDQGVFMERTINWIAIVFSILTIFFAAYACLFYWVYWNKHQSLPFDNWKIITSLGIIGVTILISLILCFINYPSLDLKNIDFKNTTIINLETKYNFIYDSYFFKNDTTFYNHLKISDYGILTIVVLCVFLLASIVSCVSLFLKRKK